MIANPEKFKAIILQKPKSAEVSDVKIQIRGQEVAPTKIDNELEFDKYISKICKKQPTNSTPYTDLASI